VCQALLGIQLVQVHLKSQYLLVLLEFLLIQQVLVFQVYQQVQ
jgi:hypothetical protein